MGLLNEVSDALADVLLLNGSKWSIEAQPLAVQEKS
jgi:hypothetical protein